MKAVRIHGYGGPEVLRYEEAPDPDIGPDDVLVRVHAAGINPVDWKVRQGYVKGVIDYPLPMILGWDVSGVVERVGDKVTAFVVTDEVYGRPDIRRNGAYAELVAVRASELAKKPRSIDHIHAAAVPLAGLTGLQTLFQAPPGHTAADLRAGQTILIHAAAGGVGSFAVQLARLRGARVIGTCSAANVDYVRALGADQVIDYNAARFEDLVSDVDVVADYVGGDVQTRSWSTLRKGGILVSVISPPSKELAAQHGARAGYVFIEPSASGLEELAGLIDAQKLRVEVSKTFPLSAAREAHQLSQQGHVRGKLVLKVAGTT